MNNQVMPSMIGTQDLQRIPSYAEMIAKVNQLTEPKVLELTNKMSKGIKTIYAEHTVHQNKQQQAHTTQFNTVVLKKTPEYSIEHNWTYCPECGNGGEVVYRAIIGLHEETREAYVWDIIKNGKYV